MTATSDPIHLLDANLAVALLDQAHIHHQMASTWFETPFLQWALCALTEGGVLRLFTRLSSLHPSIFQATELLNSLSRQPGYHYQPLRADWQTLVEPFAKRLHGHRQITDAYLLGLAVQEGLVLATFDRAIRHLAGEHRAHVYLLEA